MKMCRWACGNTLKDHVINDKTRERMEERLWRWRRKGGRPKQIGAYEWTVSTETREPSERRKMNSVTELAGG